MKLGSKASLEARKREVLGRLLDPNYIYHNTTDNQKKLKAKYREDEDDTRKRVA